jgi:ankyrin repeat protein
MATQIDTRTRFFRAVLVGDAAQVGALLEREPWLAHERSPGGSTALHLAAHAGHREVVALLLAHGADVDARALARMARTPLQVAVSMNRIEIARLLLDHGADADLSDLLGWRALHLAALRGQADLVRLLLAHGADADAVDGAVSTPLALARLRGHAEVVALLEAARALEPAVPPTTGERRLGHGHLQMARTSRPRAAPPLEEHR